MRRIVCRCVNQQPRLHMPNFSKPRLREDLELKLATGEGAFSVARERFETVSRSSATLLRHMRARRELLHDLRAVLQDLRHTLSDESRRDAGPRRPLPES
jgi:hypothetical protein